MAELVQNRLFSPVIILPVTVASHFFLINFKKYYSFLILSVPDAFASIMINDDI